MCLSYFIFQLTAAAIAASIISAIQIRPYSPVAAKQIPPSQALKKLPIWWEKNTIPNRVASFAAPKRRSVIPDVGGTVAFPVRPRRIANP